MSESLSSKQGRYYNSGYCATACGYIVRERGVESWPATFACSEHADRFVAMMNGDAVPPKARYGIPEALTYLKERAEWLDREMRNGGNVEYLARRYEECRYIASCIEDTFVRLTEADRQSSTKPEQCPCWDSWRTNCQWLANCRAKQQGAPVEPKDAFLIFYDDQERRPEVFSGHGAEEAARRRFEQISGQWNAHLFERVAVNSRDAVTKPGSEA